MSRLLQRVHSNTPVRVGSPGISATSVTQHGVAGVTASLPPPTASTEVPSCATMHSLEGANTVRSATQNLEGSQNRHTYTHPPRTPMTACSRAPFAPTHCRVAPPAAPGSVPRTVRTSLCHHHRVPQQRRRKPATLPQYSVGQNPRWPPDLSPPTRQHHASHAARRQLALSRRCDMCHVAVGKRKQTGGRRSQWARHQVAHHHTAHAPAKQNRVAATSKHAHRPWAPVTAHDHIPKAGGPIRQCNGAGDQHPCSTTTCGNHNATCGHTHITCKGATTRRRHASGQVGRGVARRTAPTRTKRALQPTVQARVQHFQPRCPRSPLAHDHSRRGSRRKHHKRAWPACACERGIHTARRIQRDKSYNTERDAHRHRTLARMNPARAFALHTPPAATAQPGLLVQQAPRATPSVCAYGWACRWHVGAHQTLLPPQLRPMAATVSLTHAAAPFRPHTPPLGCLQLVPNGPCEQTSWRDPWFHYRARGSLQQCQHPLRYTSASRMLSLTCKST